MIDSNFTNYYNMIRRENLKSGWKEKTDRKYLQKIRERKTRKRSELKAKIVKNVDVSQTTEY